MTSPARVGSDERLRLFCALRLTDPVLDAVEAWQVDLRGGRIVDRANLHITLAFLGHRPAGELDGIRRELRGAASGAGPIVLEPVRYRETRTVGMIVLRDEEGRAAALARDLHERLERLGVYRREAREWLPHLTVLRFRTRPRLELDPPATGPFMPSDAAAYLSRLSSAGARYEVLETVALGDTLGG